VLAGPVFWASTAPRLNEADLNLGSSYFRCQLLQTRPWGSLRPVIFGRSSASAHARIIERLLPEGCSPRSRCHPVRYTQRRCLQSTAKCQRLWRQGAQAPRPPAWVSAEIRSARALVATGRSYRLMARELAVSKNTVLENRQAERRDVSSMVRLDGEQSFTVTYRGGCFAPIAVVHPAFIRNSDLCGFFEPRGHPCVSIMRPRCFPLQPVDP
jgi:hypothetical protein